MTDIEKILREAATDIGIDISSIELMAAADEIERLREENEKMKYFLRHNVFAEKQFGVYFVCGDSGDKDRNGMPKDIYVCPAYGSDIIYRYKRMDSSAPQW